MHTSTGRFPFSRRSPSERRAFSGVFNITKSFGRHDKCQRPRISLQIKRCQPITPPIIRRKHRELPIFCPRSVCGGLRLQNTRKNARRHHPHMARTKTKARPSFPAHSAGRKNLRRTKCAARLFACPRTIGELSPRPSQVDLLEVVALVALGRENWSVRATLLMRG